MKKILFSVLILTIYACTYSSESDLLNSEPLDIVTFSNVRPIIESHCINCHGSISPSASLPLTNFEEVKNAVINRNLINRISKNNSDPLLMPPTGRLNQNIINIVIKWEDDGFLQE